VFADHRRTFRPSHAGAWAAPVVAPTLYIGRAQLDALGATHDTLSAPPSDGWHPRFRCADKDLRDTWRHSFYLAFPVLKFGLIHMPQMHQGKVQTGVTFSMTSEAGDGPK